MSLKTTKDKEKKAAASAEPVVEKPKKVEAKPAPKKVAPVVKMEEGKITFNMYCTLAKIPGRHRPGMRAFTKVKSATRKEWAAIFKSY